MQTTTTNQIEGDVDLAIKESERMARIKGTPEGMWDHVSSLEQEGLDFETILVNLAGLGYLDVLRSEGQRMADESKAREDAEWAVIDAIEYRKLSCDECQEIFDGREALVFTSSAPENSLSNLGFHFHVFCPDCIEKHSRVKMLRE